MGNTAKNISIVLGLITIAFAGYYMLTQRNSTTLSFDSGEQVLSNMLANTQVFITHRQELDEVELDLSLFEDPRFLSFRSFTQPVVERPIGRPDPFATPENAPVNSF